MSLNRLSKRLRNLFSFGRLSAHGSNGVVQTTLHSGELFSDIEHPQEHGFASKAPIGSNSYTFFQDGNRDNGAVILVSGSAPLSLSTGDSVVYSAGGAFVHLEGGAIHINGAAFGGLIKIAVLTTKINDFLTAYNAHSTAFHGGANPAAPLVQTDYENTDVDHG